MIEILAIFAAGYAAVKRWPWYTPFVLFAAIAPFTILKAYLRNLGRAEEGLALVGWDETALILATLFVMMLAVFYASRWLLARRQRSRDAGESRQN